MSSESIDQRTAFHRPLRLRPAVIIAAVLVVIRFLLPFVAPDADVFGLEMSLVGVLGGLLCAAAVLVWWLFFSRARWSERLIAVVVMVAAVVAMRPLMHISIQNGMMNRMFYVYAVPPTLALALVGWAMASRRLAGAPRLVAMVVALFIGCGVWALARTNGIHGGVADLEWRWTPTAEEQLLARATDIPPPPPAAAVSARPNAPAAAADATPPAPARQPGAVAGKSEAGNAAAVAEKRPAMETAAASETGLAMSELNGPSAVPSRVDWPGFRGPSRDGVSRGAKVETDWSKAAPVEIWRRAIGPGWSSFAVDGDFIYTQEQRGDEEVVSCYRLATGVPVWMHRDRARFWESNGGAGPRGTPALSDGRVYALGATGVLNALDSRTGSVIWSRNAATDTGVTVPDWGVASSPLVTHGLVVVAISGQLAAYDTATGTQRWSGPTGGAGYSSPHLVTLDGVPQILLLRGSRTISVSPAEGTLLWEHRWEVGVGIVQPAVTADGDVLISVGDAMGGLGIQRLTVKRDSGAWHVEARWTSRGLKPYFNDFVVNQGHAFGFDGSILSCIDLSDGTRKWKGGRYGNGQMILLAGQDVLLVLSEDGELALVSATADKFTEIARLPALNAKTWNHPVIVGDTLLVRNGEEMAAYRLRRPVLGLR